MDPEVTFKIGKGSHRISANEEDHDIVKEVKFNLHKEKWIVVNYRYYPEDHYDPTGRQFTISFHDQQVLFM